MSSPVRLTTLQQEVVDFDEGALLVIAGPGSGKTRVLTERVRRLLSREREHFRVLCLTFTNKAANEMAERLDDVPEISTRAFIGTLHSFCTEVLANRGASVGINGLPNIFDSYQDRIQILRDAVATIPELQAELKNAGDLKAQGRHLDMWLSAISEAKNALITPEVLDDHRLAALYTEYDAALRACDAVDFDDLLLLTHRLFEDRPKIAAFYRRQYRYICVDEAQDLNETQYRVLRALCGDEYRDVMLVGDPKQAIFMWNGADPKYLDTFQADFDATTIDLTDNFRSSSSVVAAAKLLDPNYKVEGQLPIQGQVVIQECQDEESEAAFILERIKVLVAQGHPDIEGAINYERIAILGRNRFVFRCIEETFRANGIPYCKRLSSAAYQSESDLLQDFELALRVRANPSDRLHFTALAQRWGMTKSGIESLASGITRRSDGLALLDKLASEDNTEHKESILSAVKAAAADEGQLRLNEGLQVLEKAAEAMPDEQRAMVVEDIGVWRKHWNYFIRSENATSRSVRMFLSHLALGTTQQPREDGISLLTIHSAKGMEFDIVFVVAMVEGVFPDYRAQGGDLAEEARNAFVAITRSRRLLYITNPAMRVMPWGDKKRQKRSRFVDAIAGVAQSL
jgi:DNA helicase-2/ATP-dependent DNA helicase PcrA